MECGVLSGITEPQNQQIAKLTNAFMFTEEQITKQLVDMREQTDFMKKFRSALGIALREIKTLRTTVSTNAEDEETSSGRKRHPSCTLPSSSNSGGEEDTGLSSSTGEPSSPSSHCCVCAEFGQTDLNILKEYLSKMALDDDNDWRKNGARSNPSHKYCNGDKLKRNGTLIESSIRRIESLKQHVLDKNKTVSRLCQQLTQARLIRVKRETKLEQKLKEMEEWKEKYEKVKRFNEKQVKIIKGLRMAVNLEKQKIESSKKMATGLEETRRAFESLKSQAGELMATLREKDEEIAELTAKIEELQSGNVHQVMIDYQRTDAIVQTENPHCAECEKNIDLKGKYQRLADAFDDYRKSYPSGQDFHQRPLSYNAPPQNQPHNSHPYGRRSMRAAYTSPDSYRRVSRPPLRRRLPYQTYALNYSNSEGISAQTSSTTASDNTLLSPIDENDEDYGNKSSETPNSDVTKTPLSSHGKTPDRMPFHSSSVYDPRYYDDGPTQPRVTAVQGYHQESIELIGGRGNGAHNDPSLDFQSKGISDVTPDSLPQAPIETNKLAVHSTLHKSPEMNVKTSYLELGNSGSSSPCNSTTSSASHEVEQQKQPLCMNSFIRYKEPEEFVDTVSEQSSLPMDEPTGDRTGLEETSPDIRKSVAMNGGFVWHPALMKEKDHVIESKNTIVKPGELHSNPLIQRRHETPQHEPRKSKHNSHFVSYKGHKIDVTNFSIHAFRDIIWSLDGGPESSDDFIKFLASLAKKLNANPKWSGRHSMGNPSDWLALRGLY